MNFDQFANASPLVIMLPNFTVKVACSNDLFSATPQEFLTKVQLVNKVLMLIFWGFLWLLIQ